MDERKNPFARNIKSIDPKHISPLGFFLITIAGIFLAEVFTMIVIAWLPTLPYPLETFLGALILVALVFPLLYYLIFRSLLVHIAQRGRAEAELRRLHTGLEQRVEERTADLAQANQSLQDALEAAQKYQREISSLLEGARAVLEHREFPDAARSIFKSCKALTGATSGYISLVKEGKNVAVYLDAGPSPCTADPDLPMPMRGLREKAYTSGQAVFDNDFPASEFTTLIPPGHASIQNVLFAPLMIDTVVVGLLGLGNKPGGFTQDDARLASALAEIAAVALLNSRAEEQLRQAHAELEQRVLERTQELAQVNQELKAEIAERKWAESQLRPLSAALEAAANGIIITERNGIIRWANRAFTQMTGYTLDEVLGQNPRLLKSGKQDADYYRLMWETILSGQMWHGEIINRRKDGSLYFEEETITPLLDEKGEITNFIAIKQDITERKESEEAIRQSEALLRKVLESLPVGVWITDETGNVLHGNPASLEMWGGVRYVGIEQYGEYKGWWLDSGKLISPEEWAAARAITRGETILNDEVEIECFDGKHKIILNSAVPLRDEKGTIQGVVVVNQDITDHKRTEIALIDSEEKFRTLVDWTYDWEKWVDPQGNIAYTSPSCERITGYLPEEFISDPSLLMRIVHPDDRKSYEEHKQLVHSETVGVSNMEYRIIARDGTEHWIDHICRPIFGKENRYLGRRVSSRDITERKKAEEQLARQNQELIDLTNAERKQRRTAEALCVAAQSLTQTLKLEYVVDSLLDHINRIIPYDTASVALLEEEARLAVRAVRGNGHWKDFNTNLAEPVATNSIFQELLSSRKSLVIPKLADNPIREITPQVENIQSWLVAPIVTPEKAIGLVWLGKKEPEFFAQEHAEWTEALVSQAGMAIQNAWLFEQVRANSERLQFLARRLVEVQENELRYIAQELHDEVGQAITSLTLGLQLIQKEADKPEVVRTELVKIDQVVDDIMENLHRLAMDLRPASLDHLGLEAALRQHIQTLRAKLSLEIEFEMIGVDKRPPANMEIALYRIVQEALNNVVRHARASRVDVLIQRRDDRLILIVEDNGAGFDPALAEKSDRLGVFGMRERAEMLGGKLVIESAVGRGTTVWVEVPYAHSNSHRG